MQVGLSGVTVAPPGSGGCAILLIDAVSGDCGRGIARAGAGTLTVGLSLDAPGLPQLLALVERHPPAQELHLLCPGAGDRIVLGTTPVTLQTLRQDRQTRAAFIALGRQLGDGTTLVLGGANVGCGDAGQAFLQALADLLEVEVSALVRVAPSDGRSRLTLGSGPRQTARTRRKPSINRDDLAALSPRRGQACRSLR